MSHPLPDKQILIWNFALSGLQRGIPTMLLYVLESKGSSPGRQGFFMIVDAGGEMEGSVGGGIMEHKFTEMARERLQQPNTGWTLRRQVHDKDAVRDQSGMICSGEQTILLYPLQAADIPVLQRVRSDLEEFRNGTLRLSPAGIRYLTDIPSHDFLFSRRSGEDWLYEEKTGYKHHLFIAGGGHCALAFSRIMRMMDFHISLFDHRQALVTLSRNEFAHEKILLEDYSEMDERLAATGCNRYLVVMTQGYRSDDRAVRALLGKEFRYFGLLGSRAKVEKMWSAYRAEGIPEEQLRAIHAPAGFAIRSQTPEEIAISIAAEIIEVRNSGNP
jgi:xanthine dehydrogenase accessory factor